MLLESTEARLRWQLHTAPSAGAPSPCMPVYLWGMPVFRVTYSTRHTCTLPLLLPDAIVCPSSQAVQARILPPAAQQKEQRSV